MKRKKLVLEERQTLYKMHRLGYGIREVARELGRSPSTVLRELRKNPDCESRLDDYFTHARSAQEAAHQRRVTASKRKMRLKCEKIREYVEYHLKRMRSPEIIAGRLPIDLPGYKISDEAIYQWILQEREDLRECLPVVSKRRRRRTPRKVRRFPKPPEPKKSIEIRPSAANQRASVGHFEHDTVVSSKSDEAILNAVDRKSRKVFLRKIPNLKSQSCNEALLERLNKEVPKEHLHSTTCDNGPENSGFAELEKSLGITVYFSHPHCSPERGTVENRNRQIRRFLPKGTDFSEIPDDYVAWIENFINSTPLKCLGFYTPDEIWTREVRG